MLDFDAAQQIKLEDWEGQPGQRYIQYYGCKCQESMRGSGVLDIVLFPRGTGLESAFDFGSRFYQEGTKPSGLVMARKGSGGTIMLLVEDDGISLVRDENLPDYLIYQNGRGSLAIRDLFDDETNGSLQLGGCPNPGWMEIRNSVTNPNDLMWRCVKIGFRHPELSRDQFLEELVASYGASGQFVISDNIWKDPNLLGQLLWAWNDKEMARLEALLYHEVVTQCSGTVGGIVSKTKTVRGKSRDSDMRALLRTGGAVKQTALNILDSLCDLLDLMHEVDSDLGRPQDILTNE